MDQSSVDPKTLALLLKKKMLGENILYFKYMQR